MAEDTIRCDAVWQRILPNMEPYPQVRRDAAKKEAASDCRKLDEKELLQFIEDELRDRCTYLALSRKTRNRTEMRCLAAIGAAEACHAKKLEAAYFIMTGKQPCVKAPQMPKICCFTDELRNRYHNEKKGSEEYMRAAERAEDERLKNLLLCLARDEAEHADMIWGFFV